jgi:hypothetical protein
MERGQSRDTRGLAGEHRIGSHEHGVEAVSSEGSKSDLNIVPCSGLEDLNFTTERASGCRCILHGWLGLRCIGRIDQLRNARGPRQ